MKECIAAKLLPANLLTRRAAVLMRSYLSGLMENWLFAPIRSTCMRKRGTTSLFCWRCINSARRYAARRACQLKGSARMGVNFSAVRRYSPALRSAILRACDDPGILRHLHSFILTMLHTISRQRATFIFIITLLCFIGLFSPVQGRAADLPDRAEVQSQLNTLNKQKN